MWRPWAVLALIVALCIVPVAMALTHGPGQWAAGAKAATAHDHGPGHDDAHPAHDHGPQDMADHDHTTSVILTEATAVAAPPQADLWAAQSSPSGGLIRDGPRRPPRFV